MSYAIKEKLIWPISQYAYTQKKTIKMHWNWWVIYVFSSWLDCLNGFLSNINHALVLLTSDRARCRWNDFVTRPWIFLVRIIVKKTRNVSRKCESTFHLHSHRWVIIWCQHWNGYWLWDASKLSFSALHVFKISQIDKKQQKNIFPITNKLGIFLLKIV